MIVREEFAIRINGKTVDAPACRAECDDEACVPAMGHETDLGFLAVRIAHVKKHRRSKVAPRCPAVVRIIDRIAMGERGIGPGRVRLPIAEPEIRNARVKRGAGPNLFDVGHVLPVRVGKDAAARFVPGMPLNHFDCLFFRAFLLCLLHSRGHLLTNPLVCRGVSSALMAVESVRFFPIAANRRIPVHPNPAERAHVRILLSEECVAAPQSTKLVRQRVLGIPLLVVQHARHHRHGALAQTGQRHQPDFIRPRRQTFLKGRPDRRC